MRDLTKGECIVVAGGAGLHKGFGSDSGQGNLDNDSSSNDANSGTTSESGPRGVLKNGNTDNPNYVLDLPGAKR